MNRNLRNLLVVMCVLALTFSACSNANDNELGVEQSAGGTKENEKTEDKGTTTEKMVENPFKGEELSILVSTGWMGNRYDDTIERFEETYDVVVDLQAVPGDQYFDILYSKLGSGTSADIFWIQSNPFAIGTTIADPEAYCLDFTGEEWGDLIPEARKLSCEYDGKLYGLQLWHNSPEFVMLYNKTLFDELGLSTPNNFEELKALSAVIAGEDIVPWFVPGADGWQHQLSFFQIGGTYEAASPGLYEALNNNTATFAGNEQMLTQLAQFKELADAGYFGEDWIGSNSTNMINDFGDRKIAMAMRNSSYIKQIKDETGTTDEFGLFLIPLADNKYFPTNPAGPTMFGYKGTPHPELVKEFFDFVTTTESLQEILNNSPDFTNLAVNDPDLVQNWLPEEEEFMSNFTEEDMKYSVLQTGTIYTNNMWMDFGADMIGYCQGTMDANDVLKNLDISRAEQAKLAENPNW